MSESNVADSTKLHSANKNKTFYIEFAFMTMSQKTIVRFSKILIFNVLVHKATPLLSVE